MNSFRTGGGLSMLPVVVKNLLIINGLFFLADIVMSTSFRIDLVDTLGMHYFKSSLFEPYQMLTYLFMHGNLGHLFFNMFAVWMFGSAIENYWGPKRFLNYYLITGFGAAILHYAIIHYQIIQLEHLMDKEQIATVLRDGAGILQKGMNYNDPLAGKLNILYNGSIVGASGSLFGILLAFGMLFPNEKLMLIFFPVPIKAKYFVAGYGAIELYSGIANNPGDNVAHFAHLGGMLFGFILIKLWQKRIL